MSSERVRFSDPVNDLVSGVRQLATTTASRIKISPIQTSKWSDYRTSSALVKPALPRCLRSLGTVLVL